MRKHSFTVITRSLALGGLLLAVPCLAQGPLAGAAGAPESSSTHDARMKWWREARFGMFVHWGLYSGLAGTWEGKPAGTSGGMEWIQNIVKADTDTYARAAVPKFRPKPGFAREWARLAKAAGCSYVVFTTKHHEGFALHNSRVGDFDAGSILQRDLVKEIVTALRAEGLRVGFYHSVIDWHHDQYDYSLSQQLPHPLHGKPSPNGVRDHSRYLKYLHAQAEELVTGYGRVDVLWWDYSAQDFQGDEAWRATELMNLVRKHQPAVIMNNRLFRTPEAGWKSMGTDGFVGTLDWRYGDFITPEQHIPDTGMPGVDWETCMTMNTTWGYSEHDRQWKTSDTLIRNLVDIASKGGNYLLNIGPQGDGSVPTESVAALHAVGDWMKGHRESIVGTMASPVPKPAWGRITARERKGVTTLFLHVFDWPANGQLTLAGVPNPIRKARLLGGGKVTADSRHGIITITGLAQAPNPVDSVIALTLDGPLVRQPGVDRP
ncbi:MAG: alpha-L-fucosidase [Verrucomicrobiales bacterium]|nr:alpha-L-fucosidase [Verrucomicrobiales bacterium]